MPKTNAIYVIKFGYFEHFYGPMCLKSSTCAFRLILQIFERNYHSQELSEFQQREETTAVINLIVTNCLLRAMVQRGHQSSAVNSCKPLNSRAS